MSEKDSTNSDRFFESLFYGHPMSAYIRTPDGRVLVELDKQGRADAKRHEDIMAVQGELVRTLQEANRGTPTISRDDFRARQTNVLPAFREAVGRIQDLNRTQSDLLAESRVLTQIVSEGFGALGGEMVGVRHEVRGVRTDLADLGEKVTTEIRQGTKVLQGPELHSESLTGIASRGQLFFDALERLFKRDLNSPSKKRS